VIAPRLGLAAAAVLALVLARKRPALRPVAVTLAALAAIDIARAFAPPPRVDAALWIAWACVQAAFAWRAWKDEGPGERFRDLTSPSLDRAFPVPAHLLITFAIPALPFLPVHWSPLAWRVLLVAPHVGAVVVGLVAWAGARPRTAAQTVALVLTCSAALDLTIGALAPGAGWVRAAPLAWATWGAIGAILVVCALTNKR
jgi:hypothetical protein